MSKLLQIADVIEPLAPALRGLHDRLEDRDWIMSPSYFYGDVAELIRAMIDAEPLASHKTVWLETAMQLEGRSLELRGSDDGPSQFFEELTWQESSVGIFIRTMGAVVNTLCKQIGYEAEDYEDDGVEKLTLAECFEVIHDTLRSESRELWLSHRVSVTSPSGRKIRSRRVAYPWVKWVLTDLRRAFTRMGESTSQGDRAPRTRSSGTSPFSGGPGG